MELPHDIRLEPASAQLRARTRALHDAVDTLFSRFDLVARSSYGQFLQAQYRAVAAAENALAAFPSLPAWRPRIELIAADLSALDLPLPAALRIDLAASRAKAHGLLYVIEGSRLGGRFLLRSVAPDFPRSFLADGHQPGEWRRLLASLDAFVTEHEEQMHAMLAGAEAGFGLFAEAASVTAAKAAR